MFNGHKLISKIVFHQQLARRKYIKFTKSVKGTVPTAMLRLLSGLHRIVYKEDKLLQ